MRLQRGKDRLGVAWIDCGGVDAVMYQPQIVVVERRNREDA
jgi:hypothetical protein